MKTRDILWAAVVIIVWGVNFAVIKFGVQELPPFFLVAVRYFFAAVPMIFFVKRPTVSWKYVTAYGLTMGVGQFSCLFYAVRLGMPAGIASVILQAQAFFTLIFAMIAFRAPIKMSQILGLGVAGIGLLFISGIIGLGDVVHIPTSALLLTLGASAFWAMANIIVRKASIAAITEGKSLKMLDLVVWSSLVPPIPMLLASWFLERPQLELLSFTDVHFIAVFSVLYLALLATDLGCGLWSVLLAKYPAQKVAPLSLLVPVVGLITAEVILNEHLAMTQWLGGLVIIIGLLIANGISIKKKRV